MNANFRIEDKNTISTTLFFKIHKFHDAILDSPLNKIDIMWPCMADIARQQGWRLGDYVTVSHKTMLVLLRPGIHSCLTFGYAVHWICKRRPIIAVGCFRQTGLHLLVPLQGRWDRFIISVISILWKTRIGMMSTLLSLVAPHVVDTTADTAIDKKITGRTGCQKSVYSVWINIYTHCNLCDVITHPGFK